MNCKHGEWRFSCHKLKGICRNGWPYHLIKRLFPPNVLDCTYHVCSLIAGYSPIARVHSRESSRCMVYRCRTHACTHWLNKSFTLFNAYPTTLNTCQLICISSVNVLICSKVIVYSKMQSDLVGSETPLFLLCTMMKLFWLKCCILERVLWVVCLFVCV